MNYLASNNLENNNKNQMFQTNISNQSVPSSIQNNKLDVMTDAKLEDKIVDVYEDNFIKEIKRIGKYLRQYPYVGMDTEFPGVVYPCLTNDLDFYYQFVKENVDKLKLIQLGITLTNSKGEQPPNTSTWQFNLRFDCDKDEHSNESINLLINSGINFNKLKREGIPHRLFAEYLTVSGLVLNEAIIWISFNGLSDFAYLLKLLIGEYLPNTSEEFQELMKIYFPNTYDIKHLINENELYKGGLNKIAKELNIERKGEVHQAGSDSLITIRLFFTLIENNTINKFDLNNEKNILYGIGEGADDNETILYTKFAPGIDISNILNNISQDINIKGFNNKNSNNNIDIHPK